MQFGIIGFGRFGQLWAQSFLPFGDVLVYDKHISKASVNTSITFTDLEKVAKADVVFVLVPISEFEHSCIKLQKMVAPTTLIVDCCSVKIYPVDIMRHTFASTQPLLATHPLFGPDSVKRSNGLTDHKIAICPIQPTQDKHDQLQAMFKKMGLISVTTTPEEHDKQMAYSQGLVHFLGRGLQALHLTRQTLATPDFETLLNIDSMVANDTWQLFLDMNHYNPFAKEIRQKLIDQLAHIDKRLEGL